MSNSMHLHLRAVALVAAVVFCAVLPSAADAQVRCNGLPLTMPPGSDGPDVITGTAGRDVIATLGGNDRVFAGPGDDVVCLGDGNDSLNGGAGDDLLRTDDVPDGSDSFVGGAGVDSVHYLGRAGSTAVSLDDRPDDGARDERDNIHADVENVLGGRGSNTLRGSAADNVLVGGDTIDVINSGSGDDELRGGAGNDIFVPGLGDDSIRGGDGDDQVVSEAAVDGADRYLGGSGDDTMSYEAREDGIRVFFDGAANDGARPFGEGDNVGANEDVEHVVGGGGDDIFNARAFFGGLHLEGGPGDDGFTTTNGVVDIVDGGLGTDGCLSDPTDVRRSCER